MSLKSTHFLHLFYYHSDSSHLHLLPKLLLKPPNVSPGLYFPLLHPLTLHIIARIISQKYKYCGHSPENPQMISFVLRIKVKVHIMAYYALVWHPPTLSTSSCTMLSLALQGWLFSPRYCPNTHRTHTCLE